MMSRLARKSGLRQKRGKCQEEEDCIKKSTLCYLEKFWRKRRADMSARQKNALSKLKPEEKKLKKNLNLENSKTTAN